MVQRLEIVLFRSVERRSDQEWSVVCGSENTPSFEVTIESQAYLFGVLIVYTQKHRARRKCSYVESRNIFRCARERRILTGTNEQQRAAADKMFHIFLLMEPK